MRLDDGDAALDVIVAGEGPLVIALHGFPDSRETFRAQVPTLLAAGYRVARPAMRGYAPSGPARSGRYDIRALADDVLTVADALSPGEPVRLLGHDWGAIAACAAAQRAPERVSHLVTIAVPPPRLADFLRPAQARRSAYIASFQLPGAERRLAARRGELVERLWRAWSPGFTCPPDLMAAAKAAVLADPSAVLGYYRALPRGLALAQPPAAVPQLHLHGDRDGCVGVEVARRAGGPHRRIAILPGGHFLHLEAPLAVNARLLHFFGERP